MRRAERFYRSFSWGDLIVEDRTTIHGRFDYLEPGAGAGLQNLRILPWNAGGNGGFSRSVFKKLLFCHRERSEAISLRKRDCFGASLLAKNY